MWKVLIVDNRPIERLLLKRQPLWNEMGFEITDEASNGKEALEKLKHSSFDLLITDIMMPVMTGIELLKYVKIQKLVPCAVILSELNDFYYAKQAIAYSIFDYLVKPIDPDTLKELLVRADCHLKSTDIAAMATYPSEEIEQIHVAIKNKDNSYITKALNFMSNAYYFYNQDIVRTSFLMKKIISQMISNISNEYPWIQLFWKQRPVLMLECDHINNYCELEHKIKNVLSLMVEPYFSYCLGEPGSFTEKICLYVIENIEKKVSLRSISDDLYTNASYLSNHFKMNTGLTLTQYITNLKIERAKYLLEQPFSKTYEVAQQLGFDDDNYFSRIFKKTVGISPSDYVKNRK